MQILYEKREIKANNGDVLASMNPGSEWVHIALRRANNRAGVGLRPPAPFNIPCLSPPPTGAPLGLITSFSRSVSVVGGRDCHGKIRFALSKREGKRGKKEQKRNVGFDPCSVELLGMQIHRNYNSNWSNIVMVDGCNHLFAGYLQMCAPRRRKRPPRSRLFSRYHWGKYSRGPLFINPSLLLQDKTWCKPSEAFAAVAFAVA